MQKVIAAAAVPAGRSSSSEHAMTATRRNHAQSLDVNVNQLTWMLADVAKWSARDPVKVAKPRAAVPAQDGIDGRAWVASHTRQPMRALLEATPQPQDARDLLG
jgi:hypothetical protein